MFVLLKFDGYVRLSKWVAQPCDFVGGVIERTFRGTTKTSRAIPLISIAEPSKFWGIGPIRYFDEPEGK